MARPLMVRQLWAIGFNGLPTASIEWEETDVSRRVVIDYTNWRGIRAKRLISPNGLKYAVSVYHKADGHQWFVVAMDVEKKASRDFALKDIHAWEPC